MTSSALKRWFDKLPPYYIEKFSEVVLKLPQQYQDAIKMSLKGKKQKDIAAELGVSQPRVTAILKRALEVIQEELRK